MGEQRTTGATPLARYRSPWMDAELDAVRDLARHFFAAESAPHQERWAAQHMPDRDFWRKAGDAGLLCPSVPEEYGGGGGTFAHDAVVIEEQARAVDDTGLWVHSTTVAHHVLAYGTDEQKRRWLPLLGSGELVGAIAMTEPGAGSDLQNIRTTARRDGADYVVDGAKTFITNGTHAGLVIVAARTGGPGARGISLLVAETDGLAGFQRGRVLDKVGTNAQDTRELAFVGMRVPAANLLGEEGRGFAQLMEQMPQERLIIAVLATAAAERAVELAVAYAKERTAFGQRLIDMQHTRFVLAECLAQTRAARTLLDHAVDLHLRGRLDAATAAMAKLVCTETQGVVTDRCLQVFGGYGYMREYPIARLWTAARLQRIYGGTSEIMKELVARAL